jgi:(p)ppGpp synthase/HD superfamily hydrolase
MFPGFNGWPSPDFNCRFGDCCTGKLADLIVGFLTLNTGIDLRKEMGMS